MQSDKRKEPTPVQAVTQAGFAAASVLLGIDGYLHNRALHGMVFFVTAAINCVVAIIMAYRIRHARGPAS